MFRLLICDMWHIITRMDEAVDFFCALGDEERLRIINLLLSWKEGACVCELVDALRIPQYQVSRQLRVLRRVGLVAFRKRGTWAYYAVSSSLPPLAKKVLQGVSLHLENETMSEDRSRFDKRLRLRSGDLCVIGYEPDRPFREDIPVVQIHAAEGRRR